MKFLLLTAFMMPGVCAAITDPATEIVFPDPAGPWVYTDSRAYEPADLGHSYSYKPLFGGTGAITCYIYSKGFSNIPTGADSALVRREMDETVASVVEAWSQLGAKVEQENAPTLFRRTSDGRALAYYSVHRIAHESVQNVSISIVTGYRQHFVKLRYTFPGDDVERAKHQLSLFLRTFLEANRDTADPVMIPELAMEDPAR
ncbi:MAG TPA: hypothetical protein VMM36_07290 [Opitutaceae bacterium]|nr:hypothetical protein [Opitutaceae bacterium]